MLRGYSDDWSPCDEYIVPAHYHFSLLANALDGFFGWVSSGIVGILGLVFGIGWTVENGLVGLSVLIPTVIYSVGIGGIKFILGRDMNSGQKALSELWLKMPKEKRKEYKHFLNMAQRDSSEYHNVEELFRHHQPKEVDIYEPVRNELAIKLKAAKEAKRIYDESLGRR
jgi:hypothetical protein